jgi:hypothetical protein
MKRVCGMNYGRNLERLGRDAKELGRKEREPRDGAYSRQGDMYYLILSVFLSGHREVSFLYNISGGCAGIHTWLGKVLSVVCTNLHDIVQDLRAVKCKIYLDKQKSVIIPIGDR